VTTSQTLRYVERTLRKSTRPIITRTRRRSKGVLGFEVEGPDGNQPYWARSFKEAAANLAVRVRLWLPLPRWRIRTVERRKP
jgi:hypothetical protein